MSHPATLPRSPHCHADGLSDAAPAIQQLLDRRGSIHLPAGRYLIGRTLRVSGGTRLSLDPEAILLLAGGAAATPDDYLLANAHPESGDEDIVIEGGQWDGNNLHNARPPGLFDYGCSGALLHFQNVRSLRLSGLHLRDAEAYYARFTHVSGFHIASIRFSSSRIRPNNDGLHLGGNCENGLIRDIRGLHPGVTGDDMVALNADDALTRTEVRGMTCGPIRNISIEDIEATGCHSFVRLLSVWSPIENITVRNVRGTCEVAALNCDAARGCRVPVFDESAPPFPDGVGLLRDIDASDIAVAKSVANSIPLLRLETRMSNFRVQNFHRDLPKDADPRTPTLRIRHLASPSIALNGQPGSPLSFGDTFTSEETEIRGLYIAPSAGS